VSLEPSCFSQTPQASQRFRNALLILGSVEPQIHTARMGQRDDQVTRIVLRNDAHNVRKVYLPQESTDG
jgi:hypothetical protein